MAKTPSLKASILVRCKCPRLKRARRFIAVAWAALTPGSIFEGKIPRNQHRDAKDRDEGPELVDEGNVRPHHAIGAIGDRDDEPHPDEHVGAARPALPDQAGHKKEHSEHDQADGDNHRDMHCKLPLAGLARVVRPRRAASMPSYHFPMAGCSAKLRRLSRPQSSDAPEAFTIAAHFGISARI